MADEDEKLQSPEQCDGILKKAGNSENIFGIYMTSPIDRMGDK